MALLLEDKPLNINDIASRFEMSRPAVSKHIKILFESGLIVVWQEGRERYCALEIKAIQSIAEWLKPYETFWRSKLDNLELFLAHNPSGV